MENSVSPRKELLNTDLTRPNWLQTPPRDPNLLWLDKNENVDPQLASFMSELLIDVCKNTPVHYTYPELQNLYLKLGNYTGVSADCLRLTHGSDGAIRATFETFISPGDTVMHTFPTFAMYPIYCKMFGAKQVPLEYEKTNEGPRLRLQTVISSLEQHKPRLLCIPNPDSPTGTVFSNSEMLAILQKCEETGTVFLVDEAYHPFYAHSMLPYVEKHQNLIVARTFAKAWGLAGLRVGYIAAHPNISTYIHKVRPMYEVSTFAAMAVEKALDYKTEMEASVQRVIEGKEYFAQEMANRGFSSLPSAGNFIHVQFVKDADKIHAKLKKHMLYRAQNSEHCLLTFSRISVAPKSVMKKVVTWIDEALKA